MKDKLISNRNHILFIELSGLLHDIGKLSKAFLEYRQTWQDDPHGYDKDPHDHDYLDKHEVFKSIIPNSFSKTINHFVGDDFGEPDFSIKKAVHSHVRPRAGELINMMLKAADGNDSAIDRNNPLWSAEQKDKIFRSNVFGYENERTVSYESQEIARQKLYIYLNVNLQVYLSNFNYENRISIFNNIKTAFEQGLSDTTRPQNDTTLWEHSYAVASILKVLTVHNLLKKNNKIYELNAVQYGILGIGWDGMKFISYGQKIGDIIARQKIINNTKEKLKKLVEYEYPIGNEIYSDIDGIYFIVPLNFIESYKDIWIVIENHIFKIAVEISEGELYPHVSFEKDTFTLTSLVNVIKKIKEKALFRFDSNSEGFKHFKNYLNKIEKDKTICPICKIRFIDKIEDKEDDKTKICKICNDRRLKSFKDLITGSEKEFFETVFIDEIIDKNNRIALVVARFGIDNWLNGTMVRSLFVTESKGIEREINNLGKVKQFEQEEKQIKEYFENNKSKHGHFGYERIREDINSIYNDKDPNRAKYVAFLYDRRVDNNSLFKNRNIQDTKERWQRMLEKAKEEDSDIDILCNLLNAKTPTPSTVLDIWETTQKFCRDIANILKSLLPLKNRLKVKIRSEGNKELSPWEGTLEAKVIPAGKQIELLFVRQDELDIVGETFAEFVEKEWKNKKIKITDRKSHLFGNEYKIVFCEMGEPFVPYRIITTAPNLFLAFVPAERAIDISSLIYQKYIEQFGKVMGRLPFSIGNIFFQHKMPMFVVLDAGKRMILNFDFLSEKTEDCEVLNVLKENNFELNFYIDGLNKILIWNLPHVLGNCEIDYHHAYFIVDPKNKELSSTRSTYFKTIAGDVVHFSEIKKGDTLKIYPDYYDFEFLDTNSRRYDINLEAGHRRKSNIAEFRSKPYLLDELRQKIIKLWKGLFQNKQLQEVTDTKLKNLQSLWLSKYQEWRVDIHNKTSENYKKWQNLVLSSLNKEFKNLTKEQSELLQEIIKNGIFFDTLELFMSILKERID